MVKKTNKSTAKKKVAGKSTGSRWLGLRAKWWYAIIFIVLIVAGGFTYRSLSISAEKKHLLIKQHALEQILDDISRKAPPIKKELSQSCHYSSIKFEKGDLSCEVRVAIVYNNPTIDQANDVMTMASSSNNLKLRESGNPTSDRQQFEFSLSQGKNDSFFAHIEDDELNCSISFSYIADQIPYSTLIISGSCVKFFPNDQHFPLEK